MAEHYDHVQRGWLHYLVAFGGGLPCLAGGLWIVAEGADEPGALFSAVALLAGAALCMCLGAAFTYLRVQDAGEGLRVQFGPLKLFGTTVRYEDIESVEVGRTKLIEGWGLHGFPFASEVFNVWGRDCVVCRFREPRGILRFRALKIGTDEPEKLATFVRTRLREGTGE